MVAAVYNTKDGAELANEELIAHCRKFVAGYKIPRILVREAVVERFPSGKPDYKWAEGIAAAAAPAP